MLFQIFFKKPIFIICYKIIHRNIPHCQAANSRRNTGHVFVNSLALFNIYTYYQEAE